MRLEAKPKERAPRASLSVESAEHDVLRRQKGEEDSNVEQISAQARQQQQPTLEPNVVLNCVYIYFIFKGKHDIPTPTILINTKFQIPVLVFGFSPQRGGGMEFTAEPGAF